MKRWTAVFRALANENRLKIIKMLGKDRAMSVGEISDTLQISFKATSNHLALLKSMDVVGAHGTAGHVFYSLSPRLPKDFRAVAHIIF